MATWAIGDIQGCHHQFIELLERIGFTSEKDKLWFTGDLVNRGPRSLDTLRFVKQLGSRAEVVLGNHDLHLLAVAAGCKETRATKDTLDDILAAPDRDELLHWLRHRPLLHVDEELGFVLIHAGLPPQWDLVTARNLAAEVEQRLRSADFKDFFSAMYGNEPDCWSDSLRGDDRLRFAVNCFTRLRYCTPDGRLRLDEKGPPGSQPDDCLPWFRVSGRKSRSEKIIFGHWSTLDEVDDPDVYPLDTGCVWGGALTAMRLDGATLRMSLPCPEFQQPAKD